ncbi:MAG: HEPN domain-containing protein [Candidatus Brockarchaeota archaeon]|nr:HEPN domain-containing protein [Candidatus Brockarchaeota archaeon]
MAESYVKQARERLHHAEEALQRGSYPYVIRQSQEAVELSLKAALRFVGIEPPKWHDVGPILRQNPDRFPGWFRQGIPGYASVSRRLRREREPSMYGDEETGLPPEEMYTKEDAEEALGSAKKIFEACKELLEKRGR